MDNAAMRRWSNIQPGDIGFDRGVGISGFLIRFGTRSQHAHCWVYHDDLGDGRWLTIEAGPKDGVIWRIREVEPNLVVRLWKTPADQQAMLRQSRAMLYKQYGWGEIARICLYMIGIRPKLTHDNPDRVICSNHAAQVAVAGAPHLQHQMRHPVYAIWPGALAEDLAAYQWWDAHGWKPDVSGTDQQK